MNFEPTCCLLPSSLMKLLHASSHRKIEAWELVSTNIFRKYNEPVDIWFSNLYPMQSSQEVMHCLLNEQPQKNFLAMAQHSSPWVWFRKLFVAFSTYMYVNTLRMMKQPRGRCSIIMDILPMPAGDMFFVLVHTFGVSL
ncbi:uncharacterized protein LOC126625432 [Malus sylvestris]|uniref:uncharacterized protein LOC126625432 n=1 Tax=Malus sylvestris TaxID=3752 RepID=UPI0021AC1663|nr:uncharacterized protein LOC126625432 [Malus sylvestris]